MAKFKENIFFPGMRGKLGDVVISRNQYGPYAKQYTKPSQPRTQKQMAIRINLTYIAQEWRGLSENEVKRWNEYAKNNPITKKGKTYTLSGYSMFSKINGKNLHNGQELQRIPTR